MPYNNKALIDLNKKPNDLIKLEDLAVPFSNHLCDHLKNNDKQITSSNSEFLNTLRKFNNEEIDSSMKLMEPIPKSFYIDERKQYGGYALQTIFINYSNS